MWIWYRVGLENSSPELAPSLEFVSTSVPDGLNDDMLERSIGGTNKSANRLDHDPKPILSAKSVTSKVSHKLLRA